MDLQSRMNSLPPGVLISSRAKIKTKGGKFRLTFSQIEIGTHDDLITLIDICLPCVTKMYNDQQVKKAEREAELLQKQREFLKDKTL
jgi:hypothetical protein